MSFCCSVQVVPVRVNTYADPESTPLSSSCGAVMTAVSPLRETARIKTLSNEDKRLKSGGKAVYRLSGLLKGGVCERNFVVASGTHYARQSSKHGPCTNTIRQRRDEVEHHILGEIDRRLLDPKMVALMARQIETELNRRSAAVLRMAVDKPAELIALEAHIARLRAPLKAGAAGIGLGSCIRFTASSCAAPAPGSDTEPKECRVRPG